MNTRQTPETESATSDGASTSNLFLALYLGVLVLTVWMVVRFLLGGNLTSILAELITMSGAEWVMYLLIALSLFSSGVFFERLFFYSKLAVDLLSARARLRTLLGSEKIAEALSFVQTLGGMEGRVTAACLASYEDGVQAMEEAMLASLAQQRLKYGRYLSILGTLGNNAPFIGLFGTVLGIIKAFLDLSNNISGGAAAVMDGISEALVATAVGLLVAIPSVIAFNFLNGKVTQVVSNTETLARTVMEHAKKLER
jgi:biopolymer transport protein ExbB/TolQ